MKWFSGSIAEAISFAQTQKRVFVAFVEGNCDKSQAMSHLFVDEDVLAEFENGTYVCVKLEAKSISYKQLMDIYRNVPIPSLFFISHDGRPLDIVDGKLYDDSQMLKSAYLEAAEVSTRMNTVPEPSRPENLLEERRKQTNEILEAKRKLVEEKRKSKPRDKEISTTASPAESSGSPAESSASPAGSSVSPASCDSGASEVKQQQQEKKKKAKDPLIKKIEEEMEKERRQEALARQRILDQIAEDKAARAAKVKKEQELKPASSPASTSDRPAPTSSDARIQFRLPTGETKFSIFPKDTTLSGIRSYIDKNLELPFRDYRLLMTFPARELFAEDNSQTLEQLEIFPSAVLLILPGREVGVWGNWVKLVTDQLHDLLQPLYSLAAYVLGWLRPRDPSQDNSQQPSSQSNQPPRTYVKKAGNIHSLKDLRDGNDENNTWNGNSTQQM